MAASSLFLNACLGRPVDRIPVWVMRQAGRYLPEYRKLRERVPFLTLCKTPDLAAEATLQPIERFRMDAAILFSDILLLLDAMGVELVFDEKAGPRLGRGESGWERVRSISAPDPVQEMGYVLDAIRKIKGSLPAGCSLIGFSGAPFTLATYLLEGGSSRDYYATKSFLYREPAAFHRLMEALTDALEPFLRAQIRAGADAVQIFDTWAILLSPGDYREFVLPHMKRLVACLKGEGVPTIHFSLGASTLLAPMREIGADVLSLDWKIDMREARERLGPDQAVQGNLDPFALFQEAERLEGSVRRILEQGSVWPGYIFNLGHGIHPKTPLENVHRMVDLVRSYPVRRAERKEGGG
jgi:uroporphyrinogen decarboxylase